MYQERHVWKCDEPGCTRVLESSSPDGWSFRNWQIIIQAGKNYIEHFCPDHSKKT